MSMIPPDEPYSAAEAAEVMGRSPKQVRRYLESGKLRGSKGSGRWITTALAIWTFQGIDAEMMSAWRDYCLALAREDRATDHSNISPSGCRSDGSGPVETTRGAKQ